VNEPDSGKPIKADVSCPHCGHQLSQWEQVLLSVDRAIMCKNCWYRITLKVYDDGQKQAPPDSAAPENKPKDES
jgi:DNA-directed RNA polymerase subunit RPC12/RpoP